MEFNFQELKKISMSIAEVDTALQQVLQTYGQEYKHMKSELEKIQKENSELKEQLKKEDPK